MRKDRKGCVYFIDDGSGCVKIGKSENSASARMYQLQTGNPRKLRVRKSISASRHDIGLYENTFHALFAPFRIKNNIESEWFTNAEDIVGYVKGMTSVTIAGMIAAHGFPVDDETRAAWFSHRGASHLVDLMEVGEA